TSSRLPHRPCCDARVPTQSASSTNKRIPSTQLHPTARAPRHSETSRPDRLPQCCPAPGTRPRKRCCPRCPRGSPTTRNSSATCADISRETRCPLCQSALSPAQIHASMPTRARADSNPRTPTRTRGFAHSDVGTVQTTTPTNSLLRTPGQPAPASHTETPNPTPQTTETPTCRASTESALSSRAANAHCGFAFDSPAVATSDCPPPTTDSRPTNRSACSTASRKAPAAEWLVPPQSPSGDGSPRRSRPLPPSAVLLPHQQRRAVVQTPSALTASAAPLTHPPPRDTCSQRTPS